MENEKLKLQFLVCTYNEGIIQVPQVLMPPAKGVGYVVSFQYSSNQYLQKVPPILLQREDVHLVTLAGRGLSANRNNALHHATADICVIADDDNSYVKEDILAVIRLFESHACLDVALLQSRTKEGQPLHAYPSASFNMVAPVKGYNPRSIEIAFRRDRVKGIPFDERFGIGGRLFSIGEEEVWVHDLLRAGLNVQYFPQQMAYTKTLPKSTVGMTTSSLLLQSKAAVLWQIYGWMSIPRFMKYAFFSAASSKPSRSFFAMCGDMVKGLIKVTQKGRQSLIPHFCCMTEAPDTIVVPAQQSQQNGLVSVVIPVLNRASFLPRLFQSLCKMEYRPLQFVMVDNGSIDGSLDLLNQFAQQCSEPDFNIKVVVEHQQSAAAARNKGLRLAKGEYICFFDSDDEMDANFISHMVKAMAAHPGLPLAVTRTRMVFANGHTSVRFGTPQVNVVSHLLSSALSTQSIMVRTDWLRQLGGWNEQVGVWIDYELGVRLLQYSPSVVWVEGAYHRIYQHAESITGGSFVHNTEGKIRALTVILHDVLQPLRGVVKDDGAAPLNAAQLQYQLDGLYVRMAHVSALFKKGGDDVASRRLNLLMNAVPVSVRARIVAWVIRHYVRWYGKGAWRIALYLMR